MNIEDTKELDGQETQSDFDMTAATADISSELFGQGDEEDGEVEGTSPAEGEEAEPSGEPIADAAEPSPQPTEEPPAAEETSAEVQEVGAPKTWTKEALETWATIPPRAQQEILKREEDFMQGISQYKGAAEIGQRYHAVVEPYAPILAAEGIDPVQMFQSFAANHYLLTKGTEAQKVELAASMLHGYQIPLPELLNYIADQGLGEPVDPKLISLEREVQQLRSTINGAQTAEQTRAGKAIADEIDAFAADPAHPYFDELANDIQKLFGSGMANTLAEAYEKAVYANPATRQKEIDRLTAEKLSTATAEHDKRKDKIARSTADSVTTIPKSRDGTVPLGSMDDTLSETMAEISSRS
jgi:hypothetical protein